MRTIDDIRRDNLATLIAEAGGNKNFADRLGVSESQLSQWAKGASHSATGKPRGMRADTAHRIERAGGKPPRWLDLEHAATPQDKGGSGLGILYAYTVPPLRTAGEIMEGKAGEEFRFEAPDDAMAPDYPKGLHIIFSTRRALQPGRLVLVQTGDQLHVRAYAQGDGPSHWRAVAARDRVYRSFDSAQDQLQIRGVYRGQYEPDEDS